MTETKNTLPEPAPNRTYKSRLFEMIFSDKKALLELYNAVNGTHYDNPDDLEINTLENAIYMTMRNDVSFIVESRLSLYEHQSTYNPNLPLRYLIYVTDLYSSMTRNENLYSTKTIPLPTPRFVVFYNGPDEQPDEQMLCLSAAFTVKEEEYVLDLKATMLNINEGHNRELMEACRTLRDYSIYVSKVREYAKQMPLADAVERAITECIEGDILAEFLSKNRAEAKHMSIYEYDAEKHMRQERKEWYEIGREEEQENTERERRRAEQERQRAEQAEAEVARLKEIMKEMRIVPEKVKKTQENGL